MARFALSEWFMAESSARPVIRPHGEEARALRDAPGTLLMLKARAVSNHEGGRCGATSSFETHHTVGKCRLCDAPQDEVAQAVVAARLSAASAFTLAEAADS